ncbi:hypothetical protein QEG73_03190 [Chitinophagaceae bacterium 26-R-25]|nr:hypothetical protein [Chitinophagaceae bacterium 26-R-25]
MKTLLLIASLFSLSGAVCQQHNKLKSADKERDGSDSICKIFEGDYYSIADRLESRLQAVHLKDSSLFNLTDSATTNISYFKYNRPTGFYLLIKISVDSSGKFRSYEIHQNMVEDKQYGKRAVKKLEMLQSLEYSSILKRKGFLRTGCYVTDGEDVFLVVNNKSGVCNGLGIVPLANYDQLGIDYESLLSYCDNVMYEIMKRSK